MSKKKDLEKAIAESEMEIETLEQKRIRSQSSLLNAFLKHTEPSPEDVQYFNIYSSLIDLERESLRKLHDELDKLGD